MARPQILLTRHFFFYNTTVMDRGPNPVPDRPVPKPGSDEWRHLVLDKQLVILGLTEDYLPNEGAEFLVYVIEALGGDAGDLKETFRAYIR